MGSSPAVELPLLRRRLDFLPLRRLVLLLLRRLPFRLPPLRRLRLPFGPFRLPPLLLLRRLFDLSGGSGSIGPNVGLTTGDSFVVVVVVVVVVVGPAGNMVTSAQLCQLCHCHCRTPHPAASSGIFTLCVAVPPL